MKESPSLWMFQRWSILVISIMLNIIDNISTGSSITVYNIFDEMSDILPLDPEFISLEAEAITNKETIQLPHRHLYKFVLILLLNMHRHTRTALQI